MSNRAKFLSNRDIKLNKIQFVVMIIIVAAVLTATSCSDEKKPIAKPPPPIPVNLAEAIPKDAPVFVDAIGNVAAFNTVDVKSRVTGELIKSYFKAGDHLKMGQDLFTIDPAPFETKVKEGEAKLNQSKVLYEQAKREFLRFKILYSEKAISAEQLETKQVDMNSKLYQVDLMDAELFSAKLNLGYCFIKSPLDGPSGERYIDNFNIVTANQDKLVTIKQIQPIKVKFSIPGKFLDELTKYHGISPLQIEALIRRGEIPEKGVLTLIDNNINLKTGMIALEGTFENSQSILWPGQFVDVRLYLTIIKGAVLIPERAVNEGPEGKYVWVVNQDQKVSMRSVKMERRYENLAVISEGLKPEEKVVVDGQLMLRPGAYVLDMDQVKEAQQEKGSGAKDGDSNKGQK